MSKGFGDLVPAVPKHLWGFFAFIPMGAAVAVLDSGMILHLRSFSQIASASGIGVAFGIDVETEFGLEFDQTAALAVAVVIALDFEAEIPTDSGLAVESAFAAAVGSVLVFDTAVGPGTVIAAELPVVVEFRLGIAAETGVIESFGLKPRTFSR